MVTAHNGAPDYFNYQCKDRNGKCGLATGGKWEEVWNAMRGCALGQQPLSWLACWRCYGQDSEPGEHHSGSATSNSHSDSMYSRKKKTQMTRRGIAPT